MLRTQVRTGALKELARRVPWRYAGVAAVIATCLGLMPHLWASGVPAADGHAVVAAAAQAGVSAAAK
jgi:hypothetical protein